MNSEMFIHTHFGYCYFRSDGLIYNLYVEPLFRRMGLAAWLLNNAICQLKMIDYTIKPTVEAIPREDSIPLQKLIELYERMGICVVNKEVELCNISSEKCEQCREKCK